MVNLHNDGEEEHTFKAGERIAQIVIMRYLATIVEVEQLDTTVRGDGGFGSTGK
jgi:dUTP pyrophosphatase